MPRARCDHLSEPTGETVPCPTCTGNKQIKLFGCALHGLCTLRKQVSIPAPPPTRFGW